MPCGSVLPEVMAKALGRPGNRQHSIAARRGSSCRRVVVLWRHRYVFPDGELTPVSTALCAAEAAGFEVRDVESLREHYALTLRHWVKQLEARRDQALRTVDQVTYRIWRLFMSGSADGFETGRHNVYQSLLVKTGANGQSGLPLTRADLYG